MCLCVSVCVCLCVCVCVRARARACACASGTLPVYYIPWFQENRSEAVSCLRYLPNARLCSHSPVYLVKTRPDVQTQHKTLSINSYIQRFIFLSCVWLFACVFECVPCVFLMLAGARRGPWMDPLQLGLQIVVSIFFFFLGTGFFCVTELWLSWTHFVAQASFKLTENCLLCQPPKCWNQRRTTLPLAGCEHL